MEIKQAQAPRRGGVNWEQLKLDYVTGTEHNQSALARRYGVSQSGVSRRAARENWEELRREYRGQTYEGCLDVTRQEQVRRLTRLHRVADSLVDRVEEASRQPGVSPRQLRQLTGALRDLREIQGLKSELDIREQEARIERLRREIPEDECVTITMEGWLQDYSK